MTRADLEAAAEAKYPTPERVTILSARAEWERAAYVRGRLDQAEADAQIAEARPFEGVMFYTSYHQDGYEDARDEIAAAIRKGVE